MNRTPWLRRAGCPLAPRHRSDAVAYRCLRPSAPPPRTPVDAGLAASSVDGAAAASPVDAGLAASSVDGAAVAGARAADPGVRGPSASV